jgi:hypothetical protein
MKSGDLFRDDDHIGAIVHNADADTLQGAKLGTASLLGIS